MREWTWVCSYVLLEVSLLVVAIKSSNRARDLLDDPEGYDAAFGYLCLYVASLTGFTAVGIVAISVVLNSSFHA